MREDLCNMHANLIKIPVEDLRHVMDMSMALYCRASDIIKQTNAAQNWLQSHAVIEEGRGEQPTVTVLLQSPHSNGPPSLEVPASAVPLPNPKRTAPHPLFGEFLYPDSADKEQQQRQEEQQQRQEEQQQEQQQEQRQRQEEQRQRQEEQEQRQQEEEQRQQEQCVFVPYDTMQALSSVSASVPKSRRNSKPKSRRNSKTKSRPTTATHIQAGRCKAKNCFKCDMLFSLTATRPRRRSYFHPESMLCNKCGLTEYRQLIRGKRAMSYNRLLLQTPKTPSLEDIAFTEQCL